MRKQLQISIAQQRGAVLVISLIVLLVLTLIGVSAARTVQLEEKMTFASRDAKVALEVAEALVRAAEAEVEGMSNTGNFGVVSYLHPEGEGPDSLLDSTTWDSGDSTAKVVSMKKPDGTALSGRYYIELAGLADKEDPANDITVGGYGQTTGGGEIRVFRIVAQGRGLTDTTTRTIISHYGKRF
ncbi:pilus assembly PilX family protein [Microbulbifer pacificus]|uniref:PilX N-terminal domain-containing pilus assembly protein n=1 Tax=Microbulbifer pacificus TaxID=407164 RepID=A0AAU0N1K1_9GAMM|nr:PilX N-terminal domain-containing pilus assembly protein [Microbulbifer pacificus]WOX06686.1 PilX N-terminal domain-containing pilus assembly protein [Microbulbifer pacificus]